MGLAKRRAKDREVTGFQAMGQGLRSPQGIFPLSSLLSWNTDVRTEVEQPSCDHEDRSQERQRGKEEVLKTLRKLLNQPWSLHFWTPAMWGK